MFEAFSLFFFALGLIIGSFINVVIYRYGSGEDINGRSKCPSCQKTLRWFELVPVLSYVTLQGRCARCSSPISIQYPIVEFLTGLFFWAIAVKFYSLFLESTAMFIFVAGFYFIVVSILIIIAVIDFYHKIIPDRFSIMFVALSFGKLIIEHSGFNNLFRGEGLLDLLMGPILFLFFYSIWFFTRGRGMGFGDVKLSLGIGWMLGFIGGISAIVLSFWIGAIVGIALVLLKKAGPKTEVPFAPFLILGVLLVIFFNLDVMQIGKLLMI